MWWGCARVQNASELIGIRDRTNEVIRVIDREIASREEQLRSATDDAQRRRIEDELRRLRRAKTELQSCLTEGGNWESLSNEARVRLGQRMIQNLSALPGINRTAFGPLTGPLINAISGASQLIAPGQGGHQGRRICAGATGAEREELGCDMYD